MWHCTTLSGTLICGDTEASCHGRRELRGLGKVTGVPVSAINLLLAVHMCYWSGFLAGIPAFIPSLFSVISTWWLM